MPLQLVTTRRQGRHGKMIEDLDTGGGLFTPVPGAGQRPVYRMGPDQAKEPQLVFQCPVSAIPEEVWKLLVLWWQCRLLGCLPVQGGFEDQPVMVRRAFPIFEQEQRAVELGRSLTGPQEAAALAVGAVFKMMHGGG